MKIQCLTRILLLLVMKSPGPDQVTSVMTPSWSWMEWIGSRSKYFPHDGDFSSLLGLMSFRENLEIVGCWPPLPVWPHNRKFFAMCCLQVRLLTHETGTWEFSVSGSGTMGIGVRWWWMTFFRVSMENLLSFTQILIQEFYHDIPFNVPNYSSFQYHL